MSEFRRWRTLSGEAIADFLRFVRRAWELGAGMDAWWKSLEKAFGAWTQAIADVGLDWQYRRVESGEWSLDENIATPDQAGRPKGPLSDETGFCAGSPAALGLTLIPGIEKQWLQDDLRRAG